MQGIKQRINIKTYLKRIQLKKKKEYAKNRYHNTSESAPKKTYQQAKESKHNKSLPICIYHTNIFVVTILYKIICAFVLGIIIKHFFIKKHLKLKNVCPIVPFYTYKF